MTPDQRPRDIEAIARAMKPGQKRRYLAAAGWVTTTWLCPADADRLPERWYRKRQPARYTLGQAIRHCLATELTENPATAVNQPTTRNEQP